VNKLDVREEEVKLCLSEQFEKLWEIIFPMKIHSQQQDEQFR